MDGSVYITYADRGSKADGAEVEIIRSTDDGASFSAPAVVNDVSSGHQFMQAIVVDEPGIIHMSWYDTRNRPLASSNLDIYATYSTDGGATFRPNARVTPSSFNIGIVLFIGDYAGIAAAGGVAHPVWSNIFRGGWTAEAAEGVCEEPLALDYLTQLRECSLVTTKESGEAMRFWMLETLREFGQEQLSSEQRAPAKRRHAAVYLSIAEEAEPHLTGPEQAEWFDSLKRNTIICARQYDGRSRTRRRISE